MATAEDIRRIATGQEQATTDEVIGLFEEALEEAWNDEVAEALDEAFGALEVREGPVRIAEMEEVIGELRPFLSRDMQRRMSSPVSQVIDASYMIGQEQIDVQAAASLNQMDRRALAWADDITTRTIGDHYDRQARDRIQRVTREIFEDEGGVVGRVEAGERFREAFKGELDKSKSYWRRMANDSVTRSREFGRTEALVKAEIQQFEVNAILDRATSDICQALNGKIYEVAQAVELRDALMEAQEPDELKNIAPWPTEDDAEDLEAADPADLAEEGIVLPPYHGNCRTTIVAVQ